jgi:uncharacterized protein
MTFRSDKGMIRMTTPRPAALAAFALFLAAPALAQSGTDVKAGVDAWSKGDYDRAVAQWKGPAEAGDADAQFNLAQAYKLGRGVPTDLARAADLYGRAAKQGHPQAADNYGLALFELGKKIEAAEWLDKSAMRGEPRAQFVLGTMFFNGDGVGKDWVRAYALVSRAASAGLPQASKTLTQMDQYIGVADKQKGIALARRYESGKAEPSLIAVRETPTPTAAAPAPASSPAAPVATAAAKPAPAPAKPAAKPAAQPTIRDGGWRVQLGAFGDPGNARNLWAKLGGRFPGRQPYYVKAGHVTRLQVGPYASQGEAAKACGGVNPCIAVRR